MDCLHPEILRELYPYIVTVLKTINCPAIDVGGVGDHVHVLCRLNRTVTIAKLVEEIKSPTSRWLKSKDESLADFAWQNGYGAFSVSQSEVERVLAYIRNQEEHHRTMSFKEEFLLFLQRNQIEYDERYLWD